MISMVAITQSIIYDSRDWGYIELNREMERKKGTYGTLFEESDFGEKKKKLILYVPAGSNSKFNSHSSPWTALKPILESVRTINN